MVYPTHKEGKKMLKMRIFVILVFCLNSWLDVFAQNLHQIKSLLEIYRYDEAKELVDEWVDADSLQKSLPFWYYRGLTYLGIADDFRGTYAKLDSLALYKSYQALQKAENLAEEFYKDSLQKAFQHLHTVALNQAGNFYKQALEISKTTPPDSSTFQADYHFAEADKAAELACKINPKDTLGYSIRTSIALSLRDYRKYAKIEEEWIEQIEGKQTKYLHIESLVATYRDKLQDTIRSIEVLDWALRMFPNDKKFSQARLKLNVENNDEYNLIKNAKERILSDPKNAQHYFDLAIIYQKFGRLDEATEYYQKCTQLDPSNFNAVFYAAGIRYNQAVKILKEINEMNFTEYKKSGKTLELKANEAFQKALPLFERLHQLNPNNQTILNFINQIQKRLKIK